MRKMKAVLRISVTGFVITGLFLQSPVIAHPANTNQLTVQFHTGGDDLRGGKNDNVNLIVVLRGINNVIRFDNVNRGKRWGNNSIHTVSQSLPDNLSFGDIIGVKLETKFRGGIDGDNWNLNRLVVTVRIGDQDHQYEAHGNPLFRFTGDDHVYEFLYNSKSFGGDILP